jgi:hypothetical protein
MPTKTKKPKKDAPLLNLGERQLYVWVAYCRAVKDNFERLERSGYELEGKGGASPELWLCVLDGTQGQAISVKANPSHFDFSVRTFTRGKRRRWAKSWTDTKVYYEDPDRTLEAALRGFGLIIDEDYVPPTPPGYSWSG